MLFVFGQLKQYNWRTQRVADQEGLLAGLGLGAFVLHQFGDFFFQMGIQLLNVECPILVQVNAGHPAGKLFDGVQHGLRKCAILPLVIFVTVFVGPAGHHQAQALLSTGQLIHAFSAQLRRGIFFTPRPTMAGIDQEQFPATDAGQVVDDFFFKVQAGLLQKRAVVITGRNVKYPLWGVDAMGRNED